jgi:hypothetical protein
MKTTIIPADDVLAAHERAAMEISELRRKGVPCHLEERADSTGHRIDVVRDSASPSVEADADQSKDRNPG